MGETVSNFARFFRPLDDARSAPLTRAVASPYRTDMRALVVLAVATTLVLPAAPIGAAPPSGPPEVVPAPASSTDAPAPGSLDLSIRARSLGLVPGATGDTTLGLGTMRAPTGAGTTRWPSSELAPGVYLQVAPACLPGEDPFSSRRPPPARRR
jgi:hypothetical protein